MSTKDFGIDSERALSDKPQLLERINLGYKRI